MLTRDPVDPEFEVPLDRLRLCRQLALSVPEWRSMLPALWTPTQGRYHGVTRRFLKQLRGLGWESDGHGAFIDGYGRKFDVLRTSFQHIRRLLRSTWYDKVGEQCSHRKGLEAIDTLDNLDLRHWRGLDPAEAGLVRQSIVGAHITCDAKSHFVGTRECPLCGATEDSREHRFLQCIGTEDLRVKWGIYHALREFPVFSVTHGLFPEIDSLRIFQAALDSIPMPTCSRQDCLDCVDLFTDGSCLYPKFPDLRVSAGAVVLARPGMQPKLIWSGLVPGQQGVFRAELLAAAVAAGSYWNVVIHSDCWAFVRKAGRMLHRFWRGLPVTLPKAHRDLWELFWQNATVAQSSVKVVWTPAHREVTSLTGLERWKALHNQFADCQAKNACASFVERCPAYSELVASFLLREEIACKVLKFHAQVAYRFVNPRITEECGPGDLDRLVVLDGVASSLELPVTDLDGTFCPRYFKLVDRFFREVSWSQTSGEGCLKDTSFLELYILCTRVVGLLPPVFVGQSWELFDEGRAAAASDLDSLRLFRTWRKVFDKWCLNIGSPFVRVGHCLSLSLIGVKIVGAVSVVELPRSVVSLSLLGK